MFACSNLVGSSLIELGKRNVRQNLNPSDLEHAFALCIGVRKLRVMRVVLWDPPDLF